MRDKVGKLLFFIFIISSAIVIIRVVLTKPTGIDNPSGLGAIAIIVFGTLLFLVVLFISSLIIGWHVRYIRYSGFGLIGLLVVSVIVGQVDSMLFRKSAKENRETWAHNDQIYKKRAGEFRPRLDAVKKILSR